MNGTISRAESSVRSALWRNPDFLKLWFGQTVSEFGTRITREGLPLVAVITLAASPAQLGLLTAISSLPVVVFSLFIGVWIDRLPRRPIMIFADLARLLLLLTVPLAAITGHLTLGLLFIIMPLLGLLSLVFEVAYRAVLPSLVARSDLLDANTRLATSASLAEVGGPAVAGMLIQAISAPFAMIFDALSYAFSAVSLMRIRAREARPEPTEEPDMLREIRAGFEVILHHPVLRVIAISVGVRTFFGNFFAALYSYYVIHELGLSPTTLGILISAGGIGALVGTFIIGPITARYGLGRTITAALLIGGPVGLLTPLAGGTPLMAAAMLMLAQIVGDLLMMIFLINETSLRQMLVPDQLLGRSNASIGFLAQGVSPLGALVGGALGAVIGARLTLLIAVLGGLAVGIWARGTALHQADDFVRETTHIDEAIRQNPHS
ncbi:MAG: MFS transporter [bacterium]|nr:MFS transporter [bacterium]